MAVQLLFMLGMTLVFIAVATLGIFWAIRNGQFDDLDAPAQRILMDDDDPMIPFHHVHVSSPQEKNT